MQFHKTTQSVYGKALVSLAPKPKNVPDCYMI